MKHYEGDLLLIEWLDSEQSDQTWHTLSAAKEIRISLTKTVGFLVEETEEHIVVSQCWDDMTEGYEAGVAGLFTIPQGSIKSIQKLFLRKKPTRK
jgi:hypothetical protein